MLLLPDKAPVLLLCAHPDDELGCGGFISLLIERGHPVHYAYFSDCAISTQALGFPPEQLIEECKQSCTTLGIDPLNMRGFDFPVRDFPAHRQKILETLISLRKEINPALVFCACRDDLHQDHSTLSQEALRAFKYSTILGYEFPWNISGGKLDFLVRLERRHIDQKNAAWACYKTQSSRGYHGSGLLESMAQIRGIQANTLYAEAYEAIKVIV